MWCSETISGIIQTRKFTFLSQHTALLEIEIKLIEMPLLMYWPINLYVAESVCLGRWNDR